MVEDSNGNANFSFYFLFLHLLSCHNISWTKWIYIKCARAWMGIGYRVYYYPIPDTESKKFTEFRDHHHKLFHSSKISTKQWTEKLTMPREPRSEIRKRKKKNMEILYSVFEMIQTCIFSHLIYIQRKQITWYNAPKSGNSVKIWKDAKYVGIYGKVNELCMFSPLIFLTQHLFVYKYEFNLHTSKFVSCILATEWYPWNIWLPFVKMICEYIQKDFISDSPHILFLFAFFSVS